jgi:hypothetical protein
MRNNSAITKCLWTLLLEWDVNGNVPRVMPIRIGGR